MRLQPHTFGKRQQQRKNVTMVVCSSSLLLPPVEVTRRHQELTPPCNEAHLSPIHPVCRRLCSLAAVSHNSKLHFFIISPAFSLVYAERATGCQLIFHHLTTGVVGSTFPSPRPFRVQFSTLQCECGRPPLLLLWAEDFSSFLSETESNCGAPWRSVQDTQWQTVDGCMFWHVLSYPRPSKKQRYFSWADIKWLVERTKVSTKAQVTSQFGIHMLVTLVTEVTSSTLGLPRCWVRASPSPLLTKLDKLEQFRAIGVFPGYHCHFSGNRKTPPTL